MIPVRGKMFTIMLLLSPCGCQEHSPEATAPGAERVVALSSIRLTATGPDLLRLGEPFFVDLTATNETDKPLRIDDPTLAIPGQTLFWIRTPKVPSERLLTTILPERLRPFLTAHGHDMIDHGLLPNEIELPPRETRTFRINVGSVLDISVPGGYVVHLGMLPREGESADPILASWHVVVEEPDAIPQQIRGGDAEGL